MQQPASLLPFEVVEGDYATIFGRFDDPARRSGVPVRCVMLRQMKTGAKRGTSPVKMGFYQPDLQDLRYLAHAANAYPKLVAALRRIIDERGLDMSVYSDPEKLGNGQQAMGVLREIGEAS